jgi:asparagine synthase (glutamine-hydrolysing)
MIGHNIKESEVYPHHVLIKIKNAIKDTVTEEKIGIAFSGGVDSSLIAELCSDSNYDVILLTIGLRDSHDVEFSKKVNRELKLPHHIYKITESSICKTYEKIKKDTRIEMKNLSWIENSIAFYHISELAQKLGLNTIVTANGMDELFCGYDAYRYVFDDGEDAILKMMDEKIDNELRMMKAINAIIPTKIVHPLLSRDFINFARDVPIQEKILGKDDLIRKHIIRTLARFMFLPEIAVSKRKKAMQYGTGIHQTLMKYKK